MLRLVVIFLVGALAWMVWWALGQGTYEAGLAAWLSERRDEGWAADYSALETRGFPNRFDTTITDVALADPETGVAWTAPFLQLLSLSYRPNQIIAVLPDNHKFSTPYQTVKISHEDARASLFLKPSTTLELDRARVVVADLAAMSTTGESLRLGAGRLAAETLEDQVNTYRLGADFERFQPTDEMRDALDPGGVLPEVVDRLGLDAMVVFDRPWDRHAIEKARPQPVDVKLTDLSARWGDVGFKAAGAIKIDENGFPVGQITIRAEAWRKVLKMAVSVGAVPATLETSLETALGLLAGPGDVLDVPLTFASGSVSLGPIPLGAAPRLVLR